MGGDFRDARYKTDEETYFGRDRPTGKGRLHSVVGRPHVRRDVPLESSSTLNLNPCVWWVRVCACTCLCVLVLGCTSTCVRVCMCK